jgi:DNA recombination protein RmuC
MEILLIIVCILLAVVIILQFVFRPRQSSGNSELELRLQNFQTSLKDDFRINRQENATISKDSRFELNNTLRDFKTEMTQTLQAVTTQNQKALEQINQTLEQKIELLRGKVEEKLQGLTEQAKGDNNLMRESILTAFKSFQETFEKNVQSFNELQREKFAQLEDKQIKLVERTDKHLEEMRATVDEKLQKTLNERLGQSFELVGKQLESVQKGLGEMQSLAQDVGGLKRVLSNVKMRGGFGEVQLSLLLEQILAPEQYEANVKTKAGSADAVEFALKLPGKDDGSSVVWLPIDAKFPKDVYEHLQNAYDIAEPEQVDIAQRNLELTIRKMARTISEKYIDPPNTTDFAIMFLPFEGIYAEVVRKASLLEDLQRQYKIVVTGPTTLAAILNSLQMGFRTLVIQKRSSEVWKILGAVKKEFENFGGLLDKAQKNIQTASNQIDEVMGKRTRAIQRKLKGIEMLDEAESKLLLPGVTESTDDDDEPQ